MAGSLDIHIATLEDSLIDGMSFANRATASYITGRRSTSFPTQSGGVFSSTNLRIMRFNLSDSDGAWRDGGTLRVAFTIHNTGPSALQPTTFSPASLFRRLRILCGGTDIFGHFPTAESTSCSPRSRNSYFKTLLHVVYI